MRHSELKLSLQKLWKSSIFLFLIFVACSAPTSEAQTVYVTQTGTKYHLSTCQYLRNSSIPMKLEEAQKRFSPCNVCHPPTEVEELHPDNSRDHFEQPADSPAKHQPATAHQCTALTKSGLRCKRMTNNTSGRCWQHEE